MKTDGTYLVLVKRPDDTNWIVRNDSGGDVYSIALEHLANCVKLFGKDQAIIAKRMFYNTEVLVSLIGMEHNEK